MIPAPTYISANANGGSSGLTYPSWYAQYGSPTLNTNGGTPYLAPSAQEAQDPYFGGAGSPGGVGTGSYGVYNPSSTNAQGLSLLSLTKNPALAGLQTGATSQIGASNSGAQNVLGDYANQVAANQGNDQGFYGQETGAIGNFYNGTVQNNLEGLVGGYGNSQGANIANTATALQGQNTGYGTQAGGLIGNESNLLGANTAGFENTSQNTLNNLISNLAASRSQYQQAGQAATNLSIGQAMQGTEARDIAAGGAGGSSYFNAQSQLTRAQQNAALQLQLSQMNRGDIQNTEQQQQGLTAQGTDMSRANIGLTGEQQQNLASNLNQENRSDIGYNAQQNTNLYNTLLGQGMGAYQYTLGQQANLSGLRSTLGNNLANNNLLPVNAVNQQNNQYLAQQGALGNLDRGNTFYGVSNNNGGSRTSSGIGGGYTGYSGAPTYPSFQPYSNNTGNAGAASGADASQQAYLNNQQSIYNNWGGNQPQFDPNSAAA